MQGFYSAAATPADQTVTVYDLAMMGTGVEAFHIDSESSPDAWTAALAEGGWTVLGSWVETGTGGAAEGPMWQANVERSAASEVGADAESG